MIGRLLKYAHRAYKLGPRRTYAIVKQRYKTKKFELTWRSRVENGVRGHTWKHVQKCLHTNQVFKDFLPSIKERKLSFLHDAFNDFNEKELCALADSAKSKKFSILGSELQQFDEIPWFSDIRYNQIQGSKNIQFSSTAWYRDIPITSSDTKDLGPDIKVPWELSRLYHISAFGFAYYKTADEVYAQAAVEHLQDWMHKNHFLRGVNWLCPMEVGLRALNIVYALEFFKQSPTVTHEFWEKITCALFDHFVYLENNWEFYDSKTSNHYLSDLVGYLALCWYFKSSKTVTPKYTWCIAELKKEWHKQILPDGTSYEGSTAYHRLVTELCVHAYLLAREFDELGAQWWCSRIEKMFDFIQTCTLKNGAFITIGDNDSGVVVLPHIYKVLCQRFYPEVNAEDSYKEYRQFGLSIIRTEQWHVSLRSHVYASAQPSGHFHNDWGSITVGINGNPFIVDPGSYVYTASSKWRNWFRSIQVHNTFYIEGHEPIEVEEKLFFLPIPEQKSYSTDKKNSELQLESEYNLYENHKVAAKRSVNVHQNGVHIVDTWLSSGKTAVPSIATCWNFTLAPQVQPIFNGKEWQFFYEDQILARMVSHGLSFNSSPTFFSPEYGKKVPTIQMQARFLLPPNTPIRISFLTIC